MGKLTGLKSFEKHLDRPSAPADAVKIEWLKLGDGESARIRFINELDEDSPNFDPERGLALVISEHSNPDDFHKKAECSMADEGVCWACEMDRKNPKNGWRAKYRFYTNVLIEGSERTVTVWSQGTNKQSAFSYLREFAIEKGSLTNRTWKIKRQGLSTDTVYSLVPDDPDAEKFDWTGIEPYNLDKVVRKVPYADQESFYLGFEQIGSDVKPQTVVW